MTQTSTDKSMQEELKSGPYAPKDIEAKWTNYWFDNYVFELEMDPDKPRFSIALPPPNITGNLHMGHALNGTLQDMLIRLKRMQGYNVLWQAGTDHAGISTQMVVERQLRKEHDEKQKNEAVKKPFSRHDMGRDIFIEHVWKWRKQYGDSIMNQYKRLGVSFTWNRIAFTMDEEYVKAIYKAFVTLYKEGQIYRGHRVTNWCPRCLTSLSDLEVEHKDTKGHLYLIKYILEEGNGHITVATTRPESIFGDVAVAVHPEDDRYKKFVGKNVRLPLTNRVIPVIADTYVDREFGTGALKITPAHDANDWEVGQRHKLESPVAIDETGKLMKNDLVPAQYQGLDRFKVREAAVNELTEKELMEEVKDYTHGVGHCERCATVIEPYLSLQWYLKMKELAATAITAVEEDRVQFIPGRYSSTFLDWMKNIRDWNISRQLWWGHRIPVWTCKSCEYEDAFEEPPTACEKCDGKELVQDEDVLDTWFSSALWPFATLGWPESTPEMHFYYPTTVLSTAREIINLWVSRMIFMSLKFTKMIPFKHVLIHPVIQTSDGKRMSKSKGNAIDPIDMIEKYGADANRFWFASMGVKGDQDVRFREEKLEEYKRFVNKLWNAGKLVLNQLEGYEPRGVDEKKLTLADKWILYRYHDLLDKLQTNYSNYDFDNVARDLYEFIWDHFCDWYLEIAKIQIAKEGEAGGETRTVLYTVFEGLMRALHPIMPFVTEELWSYLPKTAMFAEIDSIMFAPYPRGDAHFQNKQADDDMGYLMRVIRSIRNMRQTFDVPARAEAEVLLSVTDAKQKELLTSNLDAIKRLANANPINIGGTEIKPTGKAASEVISETTVFIPLDKLIDIEKSREKLVQRLSAKEKDRDKVKGQLSNESFISRAPKEKVDEQKAVLADVENQIASINAQLEILKSN
jgi:valyl-tRNA synthetase